MQRVCRVTALQKKIPGLLVDFLELLWELLLRLLVLAQALAIEAVFHLPAALLLLFEQIQSSSRTFHPWNLQNQVYSGRILMELLCLSFVEAAKTIQYQRYQLKNLIAKIRKCRKELYVASTRAISMLQQLGRTQRV